LLGLPDDADDVEIRRAYRALALQWHPDKHPEQQKEIAEQEFKAISEAYQLLSNPEQRHVYDRGRSASAFCRRPSRPASAGRSGRPNSARCRPSSARCRPSGNKETAKSPSSARARRGNDAARTFTRNGVILELAPQCHIWFARSSACVGRAYKGLENEELALARRKLLTELASWAELHPAVVVEIRGCAVLGEVSLKQVIPLAAARGENAMRFLAGTCGLPKERCRLSSRTGEGHSGLEVRVLLRLEVDGSFHEGAIHLLDEAALDVVVAEVRCSSGLRVRVEIGAKGDRPLAQKRCAAIQQLLIARGLSRSVMDVRMAAEVGEVASFYLYEEIPALTEEH